MKTTKNGTAERSEERKQSTGSTRSGKRVRRNPLGILFSLAVLVGIVYAIFNGDTIINDVKLLTHVGPAKVVTVFKSTKASGDAALRTEDSIWAVGEGIFEFKQKKLILLDIKGKPIWEKDFQGASPLVETIGDRYVVADRDTGDVYIIDRNGKILNKKLGIGIINEIKISRNVLALWVRDDNSIQLMDDTLKPLGNISVGKSKASAWSVDSIRDHVMISNVDTDENGLICQIQFFDYEGRLIQAMTIPKEVVYDMVPTDKGLTVLTDMGISAFNTTDGTKMWQEVFSRPVGNYDRSGDRFIVNINGGDGNSDGTEFINSLSAIGLEGKQHFQVQSLDVIPSKVEDTGRFIFIAGLKKLYVYNDKGKMTSLVPLQEELLDIKAINGNSVLLVYKNHYEVASVSGL